MCDCAVLCLLLGGSSPRTQPVTTIVDWCTICIHSMCSAVAAGVPTKALQGNLDPCELFGDDASIRAAVTEMMAGFGAATPLIGGYQAVATSQHISRN